MSDERSEGTMANEPMTFDKLQEHADSLFWQRAEGVEVPYDADRWCVGFAAGWNSALRQVARELDPERELETKPYYERIRVVTCPEGHDSQEWTVDEGKTMGVVTCECGWSAKCKRHNAQSRHEEHRTAMASQAMRSSQIEPTELRQVLR